MVPEQAVALGTPAHVDAATNIVSCHLPVETSLVMNEAMAWDTPAHGALLMPLPYPTATATLTMSCQQTAASNLPAVPATAVSSLANVATATPMASCGISAASDLLVNPAMVVGTPADAQQLGRAATKKPAALVSKTLGVLVVGIGFGTPGEDGQTVSTYVFVSDMPTTGSTARPKVEGVEARGGAAREWCPPAFAHFLKEKGCTEEELGKRHKQLVRYLHKSVVICGANERGATAL
ncbi:uncharacterized protein LOC144124451 [Amblyomma americanum]